MESKEKRSHQDGADGSGARETKVVLSITLAVGGFFFLKGMLRTDYPTEQDHVKVSTRVEAVLPDNESSHRLKLNGTQPNRNPKGPSSGKSVLTVRGSPSRVRMAP